MYRTKPAFFRRIVRPLVCAVDLSRHSACTTAAATASCKRGPAAASRSDVGLESATISSSARSFLNARTAALHVSIEKVPAIRATLSALPRMLCKTTARTRFRPESTSSASKSVCLSNSMSSKLAATTRLPSCTMPSRTEELSSAGAAAATPPSSSACSRLPAPPRERHHRHSTKSPNGSYNPVRDASGGTHRSRRRGTTASGAARNRAS
mmetsp:Transcript_9674/g.24839  ORF Transcript_9674/g.24839 Transcript_9674/m.24839 type:complete len:210 (+) Transcript_9674:1835-2464(+)